MLEYAPTPALLRLLLAHAPALQSPMIIRFTAPVETSIAGLAPNISTGSWELLMSITDCRATFSFIRRRASSWMKLCFCTKFSWCVSFTSFCCFRRSREACSMRASSAEYCEARVEFVRVLQFPLHALHLAVCPVELRFRVRGLDVQLVVTLLRLGGLPLKRLHDLSDLRELGVQPKSHLVVHRLLLQVPLLPHLELLAHTPQRLDLRGELVLFLLQLSGNLGHNIRDLVQGLALGEIHVRLLH